MGRPASAPSPTSPPPGWSATGLTRWDFGALPESVDLERGGIRLRGYPALVDRGDSVAIQVLDSPESAALAGRAGLRRLFDAAAGAEVRHLRKGLPGLTACGCNTPRRPTPRERRPERGGTAARDPTWPTSSSP